MAALVVLTGFVAARLLSGPGTPLEEAVALAPADSQRFTFTDWAAVRSNLDAADLTTLLERGFDADLTSASGLVESAALLDREFGWSPATVEWELLAQSPEGAVEIVSLGVESTDDVEARLEALGYQRPESEDGVWIGGTELLAAVSARTGLAATPTLQYVAVRDGYFWASDRQPFLEAALSGEGSVPEEVSEVVSALSEPPLSAVVYTGEQACESLSMGQADDTDQATADDLVSRAGELNPVTAFAMALLPDDSAEVLLGFEGEDQARTNADSRSVLAAGPAPGQGGDFADRFAVDEVAAEGSLVRFSLTPEPGSYVLSDLSSGPVLFASC